ncbi:unnamed protein product [Rotaria magnacalcarata]|uniref:Uncharacterized protein n=1 Tax=Rotaria magnacalcarata TaxID=392030 RepID=A0A816YIX9_9BILA|nr:unnamed protein product [Rotaria magnacalcarata]CAF1653907.1 unnamed protein product [Rotaria magnacalcarata]CAF2131953.1 unnamed protein product [Rotaria magnacalcarata]CAF2163784.1 unnamed protein product [Rotaria magnacalcarata]CAF3838797.1 unnamed protein product [Rotaria magnacalcarata]
MFVFFLSIVHLTLSQDPTASLIFSDCKHLILPPLCQCYHSGDQSQLRCHNIQLESIPKLPNNMRWNALDFSVNHIKSIDSYVFSDIYVEKLNLKLNHLQTVDTTAFNQIKNVKQLYIDHNTLKEFDPKTLTSPGVSLEIFDISHNPLEYLDLGETFLQLTVLQEFYAVSCQLNNTSLFTLSKLTQRHDYVKIIDLSYNNLTSLCNNLFNNFYNLIEIRLNNNNIHLIDHSFIRSLEYIRNLNLAFNSIEYVPNLYSSSLENLNLSSNNIQYLNDYFGSHLRSIRIIDFDSNKYLSSVSPRSLCFINILTLKKLSFRFTNIVLLNAFSELLCRLVDNNNRESILDLNHNTNLKCDCMLVQFEKYLINYFDLSCIQQGQDRYFISKRTNEFSYCTRDFCQNRKRENLCDWTNAEQLMLEGTCQGKLNEKENSTKNETTFINITTITLNVSDIIIQNSTVLYNQTLKSFALSIKTVDYICFFVSLSLLYIRHSIGIFIK